MLTSAETTIAWRALRQARVGAVVWGSVFAATVAASALSYVSSFPTAVSRQQIAETTGSDTGLAVLLGPVSQIGTVGGYTVYKCFAFLTAAGAIWALLAATRLLRGEEDEGRWQLMLSGSTRPGRATVATIAALGAAVLIVFVLVTMTVVLVGRDSDIQWGLGECLDYGASVVIAPAVFAAVGAVTAQLGRTRRVATGLGLSVIALAWVLRMIADTGRQASWLLWATPFGWVERMRPFTGNHIGPLLVALVAVTALIGSAIVLAARRDVGEGVVAGRDVAAPRPRGLRTTLGLAARMEFPSLLGWFAGAISAALMLSIIAKIAVGSLPDSVRTLLDKFGAHGSFLDQYLGVAFLFVATIVALLPAAQLRATADEETSGRIVHILTAPVSRRTFFAARTGLGALAVVVCALAAGTAAWIGVASQGLDASFGSMLGAGVNVAPIALVAFGIGSLVLAVSPRYATAAGYGVVVTSLALDLVASMVAGAGWVKQLSLFHYMPLVPSHDLDIQTLSITTGIALLLCAAATAIFAKRDMVTA